MELELNWTVEQSLTVTEDELEDLKSSADWYIEHWKVDQKEAVEKAVEDYIDGQDDSIFYGFPDEAKQQIQEEVQKLFKKRKKSKKTS